MRPILLGLVALVANGASEVFNGEVRAGRCCDVLILSGLDPSVEVYFLIFWTFSPALNPSGPLTRPVRTVVTTALTISAEPLVQLV